MSREKKPRTPAAVSAAPVTGSGSGGIARVPRGVYTLFHVPSAADDGTVDVQVRPKARSRNGLLARMKLAPTVLVEDAFSFKQGEFNLDNKDLPFVAGMAAANAQGGYPILSKGVVTIVDKKIVSDAEGDFAVIRMKPNRAGSINIAEFCRAFGNTDFPLWVTLHLDLGGLAGAAAGFAIPGGTMLLPVRGKTKVRLQISDWRITVTKEMWKDQGEIDLTRIPDVDLAGLGDLSLRGGTLRIALDGGIKVGSGITRWNEEKFRDAKVRWNSPQGSSSDGVYDEGTDTYRFDIPAPPGAEPGAKADVLVRVDVWPTDEIQNVFPEMVRRVRENCELLDTDLMPDAEQFIQACVDHLAGTPQAQLVAKGPQFVHAINAASYFEGFTSISAKAFKVSLELHKEAYERYMENLVAGFMELLFFGLDKAEFFEKVFGRFIKNGKEGAEAQLQKEAKTLAHAVAEETEKALLPRQQAVEAARKRLARQCQELSEAAVEATAKSASLAGTIVKQQSKLAEEQATRKILEDEIEALTRTVRSFEDEAAQALASAPRVKQLEEATAALAGKQDALRKSSETIAMLEDSVRKGMRSIEDLDALAKQHLHELNTSLLEKLSDAEAEGLAIWSQMDLLQTVKNAKGTRKDFQELIEQSMRRVPDTGAIRQGVARELSGSEMYHSLKRYEELLEQEIKALDLPNPVMSMQGPDGAAVQATLSDLAKRRLQITRELLAKARTAELTSEAILKQYIGWSADYIKDKFNERAATLRDALVKVTQINYKAVPARYYDPTFADFVWWEIDSSLQSTAELWNYLCKTVGDWFRAANTSPVPENRMAAYFLEQLGDASFNALTALLVMIDMLLQAMMKMLEGTRALVNGLVFERSLLAENSRAEARSPIVPMPARLPDEFFGFSREAVAKVSDLLHPTRVAERSGSKAAIANALERDCKAAYELDYEPQFTRARQFMVALAGAKGALDPRWLTSDRVRSTNRDATRLLQEILGPLKSYQVSMQRPPDRDLATVFADIEVGEWTPADFDKMFELLGNGISIGIKVSAAGLLVGGLFLSCIPLTAPVGVGAISVGGGIMVFGGPSDQLVAALRVAMVAFFTMPAVLGSQFDVMRVYSLAYQSVFHGMDISRATETPTDARLRHAAEFLPSEG